jgi:beta-phosphoglucomutase-like phosphatase (HAD superfamily)
VSPVTAKALPLAGIRALVFDFDGLIVDTETPEYTVWSEAYEAHGHDLTIETWSQAIGTINGFDAVADLQQRTDGELNREVIDRMILRSQALLDAEGLRPGIPELFAAADAAGIPRAIASSSPLEWVTDNLGRLGVDQGWRFILTADGDVDRAKPNPVLYQEAVAAFGFLPDEVVAFEDSPNGVKAARAAGVVCIAVPNTITANLDLSGADHLVPELGAIPPGELIAALA